MGEQYYTMAEVADQLKVNRSSVYNWVRDGKIRAVKAGKNVRVPESAIQEFLQPVEIKAKKGE